MIELIKKIILESQDRKLDYTSRNLISDNDLLNHNYVIIGPRRAGKSYYLYEIKEVLKKKLKKDETDFLLINFEDDRLIDFNYKNFDQIIDSYKELFNKKPILLFDEIQVITYWEKYVRRLADNNFQVYVTGSNSKMISKEIGSTLGARFISIKVNTLNFIEFLKIKNINLDPKTVFYTNDLYKLKKLTQEYIEFGSFPEISKTNKNKLDLLKTYLDLYVYKDISSRWDIENINNIVLVLKKIRESIGNEISPNLIYNNLNKVNVPISVKTVYNYVQHILDVFLVCKLQSYRKSFKNRETKTKYYFSDNGFLKLYEMDDDKGNKLENTVYLELLKKKKDMYYWKNKIGVECDFVIKEKNKINSLIQVTYELNKNSKERELKGLLAAMDYFKLKEGTIITYNLEDLITIDNKKIYIIPIWKWLLLNNLKKVR